MMDNMKKGRYALLAAAAVFAAAGIAALLFAALLPERALTVALPVLIVLGAAFLILLFRMTKRMNELAEQNSYVLTREIGMAVQCGKMVSFVFRKKENEILSYRNSLMPDDSPAAKCSPQNVAEMERVLNIAAEDHNRVSEAAAKLKPGDLTRIRILYSANDGDHQFSVQLKCMRNAPDIIIGCAIDCTRQIALRERADAEAAYAAAIQPKCMSQWQINATNGVWRCMYAVQADVPESIGMKTGEWTNYEAVLDAKLRDRFAPQDYFSYVETMSCEGICAMYRSGKTEFTMEYRVKRQMDSDFEWHRQIVRIFEDPESGSVLCDLFVQNVNAEKKAELERHERARIMQKSLTALGGVFFGLYYVDLVNNLCYTSKARGGEIISRLCAPYPETLNAYAEEYVHPDDREAFLSAIDAYKLRRSMTEGSRYEQFGFRGLRGEEYYWSSMFIQPARFENGTLCDVVIALQRSEKKVSNSGGRLEN